MNIQFATCNRHSALEYIKRVYPDNVITDTDDCAKPLLDLVQEDYLRIQDPMMYGNRIGIMPGKRFDKCELSKEEIQDICKDFVASIEILEDK